MTEVRDYLDDIIDAVEKIERYTDEMNDERFVEDEKTVDAVLRNFEMIGGLRRTSLQMSARSTKTCRGRRWQECATN